MPSFTPLPKPHCFGMDELAEAATARAELAAQEQNGTPAESKPVYIHLAQGLALTTGSALGERCPSKEDCLAAFVAPNSVGLTAGARAWSKHAHRGGSGWWGHPSGPVAKINERALELFHRVMENATWRNLHWLPHQILVYEVRVAAGYGMRFAQDRLSCATGEGEGSASEFAARAWLFRGFLEPQINNGHEIGWRHDL
ncbi:hypothetical protein PUNSTDRAFT_108042 [Punctularia strigosozonata HHB-11173 SS5]|uniref:Uncharacterized protein n=1 Tax=Punctularia strigosozonata (strain HHB-11173) TaxID=741275 RepID=R7S375_PUNST|nr:uncharacterized protein PUNSTDRAFT_108042 [Punctularia strigosozonata HHB-11173 SS5]EIN04678.1 hypothetical protein PUNSTDRAFT_108042 [Punctularia strigosozonata HHB-11173 SS5]